MKTKTGKLVKKMIHDKINSIVEAWKNIRAIFYWLGLIIPKKTRNISV